MKGLPSSFLPPADFCARAVRVVICAIEKHEAKEIEILNLIPIMIDTSICKFTFGTVDVYVACRGTPEEVSRFSLTLQNDTSYQNRNKSTDRKAEAVVHGKLHSQRTPEESDLVGLDLWPASLTLCEFLVENADVIKGKEVVELGSGTIFL